MPRTLPPDIKRDCWVGVRTYVPRAPAEWPGYHSTFPSREENFALPYRKPIDRSIRKPLVNHERSREIEIFREGVMEWKVNGFRASFCLFVTTIMKWNFFSPFKFLYSFGVRWFEILIREKERCVRINNNSNLLYLISVDSKLKFHRINLFEIVG